LRPRVPGAIRREGRAGIHRTFIGSVERGERSVSILNLRVIARALRVPITELLDADKQ
jgi:hypothetical protein